MYNTRIKILSPLLLVLPGCVTRDGGHSADWQAPNVVFILCDDLGYGDIGCYGATDIQTPNIDRMAARGIRLTGFYSVSPVSSPSRAGLLTGRYPVRMGISGVFFPESWTGMPVEEYTMAEMFREKGYTTGITGKWHLGHHRQYLPLQRGFDEYFGVPYSNDMEGLVYMRGNEVVDYEVDQRYITENISSESLDFIERNRNKPFFLFISHVMPHVPLYVSEEFENRSDRGLYGDVVEEIDWSVGEIIGKLEDCGILDKTVVVFTSDNGPWISLREMGGSAGILRDGKFRTFEGGMRVPAIVMWKKAIKSGTVHDGIVAMTDWLPTFASLAGARLPSDREYDGVDITNVLLGEGNRAKDDLLYFANEGLQAYRKGGWKVKKAFSGHPGSLNMSKVEPHGDVLFNLTEDPGEAHDLSQEYPEKLEAMLQSMDSAYRALGELPPRIVMRIKADKSHEEYLRAKYNW